MRVNREVDSHLEDKEVEEVGRDKEAEVAEEVEEIDRLAES